jgi:hypothetical protein
LVLGLGLVSAGCGARHGLAADGAPPPCTPGADQTCNDDPTISSLWGMCAPPGDCLCKDGFSVNPTTGRCRKGSLCVASGADPWAVSVRLDATDCETRRQTQCSAVENRDDATGEVANLVRNSCMFPDAVHLRVELVAGCPTLFELDAGPGDSPLAMCLERVLSSARWSCLSASACALYEWDVR